MRFGEKIKQELDRFIKETGHELGRMGVQGQAELGSALFTGSAYVPYGQGQNRDGAVQGMEGQQQEAQQDIQRENEGLSL
ncbi:MAG: hypothetical protein ABSG53_02875 [Thermoguttaceae bacterium]|jgi:hypothetical protein